MSLSESKGNMYRWTTHTHTHLAGACPHACTYCYVQAMERRFRNGRYVGPVRMVEKELAIRYGSGKVIFVEHCIDLFATAVPQEIVEQVLAHCCKWPDNEYVFQTRNPSRVDAHLDLLPPTRLIGTTIETDDPDIDRAISP